MRRPARIAMSSTTMQRHAEADEHEVVRGDVVGVAEAARPPARSRSARRAASRPPRPGSRRSRASAPPAPGARPAPRRRPACGAAAGRSSTVCASRITTARAPAHPPGGADVEPGDHARQGERERARWPRRRGRRRRSASRGRRSRRRSGRPAATGRPCARRPKPEQVHRQRGRHVDRDVQRGERADALRGARRRGVAHERDAVVEQHRLQLAGAPSTAGPRRRRGSASKGPIDGRMK